MSNLIKYPRTMNLPWSESNSSDDVWWTPKDVAQNFNGRQVVMTEKLDGECTTMYRDHIHARSLDSLHHPSRAWVKNLHGTIAHEIPEGYRICGENVYAWHSVFYSKLPAYFFVFGIYDEQNNCLSWQDTQDMCEMLNLFMAPLLYEGIWDEKKIRERWTGEGAFPTYESGVDMPKAPEDFKPTNAEGYVIRITEKFHYNDFRRCAAKYVRSNHVTTPTNWMTRPVTPNLLNKML